MERININKNEILIKSNPSPKKALILIHGRGATAENIMAITDSLSNLERVIVFAPQAHNYTWYPYRFLEEQNANEPYLSQTIDLISKIIKYIKENYSIAEENIILFGFSQGACLVAEYLKRNPKRYRGAVVASGGLIGTDTEILKELKNIDLQNTPVYFGCDIYDIHIPEKRFSKSAGILKDLNANVDYHLYNGLGHSIHQDAIVFLDNLLAK